MQLCWLFPACPPMSCSSPFLLRSVLRVHPRAPWSSGCGLVSASRSSGERGQAWVSLLLLFLFFTWQTVTVTIWLQWAIPSQACLSFPAWQSCDFLSALLPQIGRAPSLRTMSLTHTLHTALLGPPRRASWTSASV